ncbi:hypothetical protein KIW84_021285 [Lathyrus oleraceus]|uniref:Uncharacterized protein n=1 Tax=Pisum sativum TaxID=3888 RepID=A0A9D4YD40_PEA|nr:hypothetical protein KIW84_021285 [Pisum sativum]
MATNKKDGLALEYHQFDLHQDFDHNLYTGFNSTNFSEEEVIPHISSYLPSTYPHPSAFLGPKWTPDMAPVLRPGGNLFKG